MCSIKDPLLDQKVTIHMFMDDEMTDDGAATPATPAAPATEETAE